MTDFVVCAYHTPDELYTKAASYLAASLLALGLPHDVGAIEGLPKSWMGAACYKPKFILLMLDKHKGKNVLYVDADAVFVAKPELLFDFSCDIGYVNRKGVEALSGTIFFRNNMNSRRFLSLWTEKMVPDKTFGDQTTFQRLLKINSALYSVGTLPESYAKIFDLMRSVKESVIIHYQASRVNKGKDTIEKVLARIQKGSTAS